MDKREFIDRLRMALNGKISPAAVAEHINYYEDYINIEIRKGRSEEEVLRMLGDPRLIARTIVETNSDGGGGSEEYQTSDRSRNYGGSDTYYQNENADRVKQVRMPGWLLTIIIILIVVLIFSTIFSVLSFLAPVLIPIIVVMFMVKLFRDWLN